MSNTELIQAHHLSRRAVIYIRQSTGHQVLTNAESRKMQLAMTEHAKRLGWDDDRIKVVETDTGISAQSTVGRDGYKTLLSEVAVGEVGIVLSYESARLSRNCSDWYPLLDICTFKRCLIGDRDGVYDPSSSNGRMLLGMKGMLSEIELHTLQGRLIAGVQNKARRGELALALPAGLHRIEDGRVFKDPDLQVQKAIELVFRSFLELRSAAKVVRHFNENDLRVPKRHRNDETIWRSATLAGMVGVLRNPAYAGAFVYGRTRSVRELDKPRPQQRRRAMNEWSVVVKDRYPSYISWEAFERIQSMLADNRAEYDRNKTRGIPRDGAALLHGIVYCGECGHKMVVQYKGGTRYLCNYLRTQRLDPVCQFLPADPVDKYVVEAFLEALSTAELNLYDRAADTRNDQWADVEAAQNRQIQRLRYEADLARRQYDRVDPDNRLVAGELERRWNSALQALRETETKFTDARRERDKIVPLRVSRDLRQAFESLGQALPKLWQQETLKRAQRKALLRCLIEKVVIHRKAERELLHVRIVWRGDAVSESDLSVSVGSLTDMSRFKEMERRILSLESEGKSDEEIATLLTGEGFRSPQRSSLLRSTVQIIRLRHGRIHRFRAPRPRRVEGALTLPQIAKQLDVKPHWLYHLIKRGLIEIDRDPRTRLFLFPDNPRVLEDLRRLRDGTLTHVNARREDQDA